MKSKTRVWIKRFLVVASVGFIGCITSSVYVGYQLLAPVPRTIGAAPESLGGKTVEFPSRSGGTIVGWLTESHGSEGCVLLLHAIRADRRSMVDRARFLRDEGYDTLCIDFQAHGESLGGRITMGHLESMDAAAGVAFLRERFPNLPVAVIGTSLGGAAALMADYEDPPEALVVEAVFSDAETAIGNRFEMRLGRYGKFFTPLLTWQIQPILGIAPSTLSPVRASASVAEPVLVIQGENDRHAKPSEAAAIYTALKGQKELWVIPGAAHVDLHRFAANAYEERVVRFLKTHLNREKTSKP
jgi:uncharacterized protein